ncbi:HalOD1 output domain-containing protein [Halohasta litorea]|uniref:HalOD1 output domain-containing protein n=1 Tax=Halohasta litorea TaxID=869891 RepID=A0ABD6DAI0_9EURY|nr:HalOD1 output domain-containing protein [Halohasta litorea]MEA1932687.1 HalOD1 output domain-containing protein [Euryarchaeota archaeon]
MPSETPLSVRLPQELATHQGVDPTELTPPVGDVIDIEALERTVSAAAGDHGTPPTTVTFEYDTLTVTVEGSEQIDIAVEPTATHRPRPQNLRVAD